MIVLKHYSVSELRAAQAEIFDALSDAPVVITRQGKPAGVLVDTEKWNQLLENLEDLEDSVDSITSQLALAKGDESLETFMPQAVEDEPAPLSN